MYQNTYQNGQIVELLSPQGGSSLKNVKVVGPVAKTYEKQIKGNVFLLDTNTNSKIQFPKDEKQCLALLQQYLVLQVYIVKGKSFTLEVTVADSSKTRRRLLFTTSTKELVINPLHARIPINYVMRNQWLNLSVDILSFCNHCFKGVTHRAIDGLCIGAHCKLRRVFTMKSPLLDTNDEHEAPMSPTSVAIEMLPKSVEYHPGVVFSNQVFTADKIGVDNSGEDTLALNAAGMHIEPGKTAKTMTRATIQHKSGPKMQQEDATGTAPASGKSMGTALVTATCNFDQHKPRSGFHATANEPFAKQLGTTISSNQSTQASTTKRSVRAKNGTAGKKVHSQVLKTPDMKCVRTPLEIQTHDVDAAPTGYPRHKPSKDLQNRDKSEPPRKSPAPSPKPPLANRRGSNGMDAIEGKAKGSSKSPHSRMFGGTQQIKSLTKGQPHAHRLLVFDQSAGSIEEQEEYENSKPLKKNGSQIAIHDEPCATKKEKPGKEEKKALRQNVRLESKLAKAKVRGKAEIRPKPGNGTSSKTPTKDKPAITPSAMLQQTVGGTQLNSFKIPGWDAGAKESDGEIEEDIEGDDKQSMVSKRDEEHVHDETPLVKSIMTGMNNTKGMAEYCKEGGTAYSQKKWVIARDKVPEDKDESPADGEQPSEEVKFVDEDANESDEAVETIGEPGQSIMGAETSQSLIKNGLTFRPFTPPFAQLMASPAKLKQGATAAEKKERLCPEHVVGKLETEGIEFKGIEEVFGEDEGKIDVVYDPILKCYYDPKTNAYYQIETPAVAAT